MKFVSSNNNSVLYTQSSITGQAEYLRSTNHIIDVNIASGGGSGGTASSFGAVFPGVGTAVGAIDSSGNMAGLNLDSSGNLKISGSFSVGGTTDNSAYTAGTSTGTPSMGFYHSTIDTVTDGRAATIGITSKRAMLVNLNTAAGAEIGTSGSPLRVDPTGTTPQPVTMTSTTITGTVAVSNSGTFAVQAAQSGTWNITNISGTISLPTGAATEATLAKLPLTQGSSTSGQSGVLTQGAVTTASPSYTNTQTAPLSLDTAGNLRTTSSIAGTALPISGAATAVGVAIVDASGNQITSFGGGSQYTDGASTIAHPIGTIPVYDNAGTIASVSTTNRLPVSATQSGTWNITNISGTISLPTGAATAAKQPALGTAGTPSSDVITVQGISGGTPQPVSTTTVDVFPATQNITAQDTGTSTVAGFQGQSFIIGSPTANSAATFTLSGMTTVNIQTTGIWTGSLRIEASTDGGTVYVSKFSRLPGTVYAGAATVTSNAFLIAAVSGCTQIRVRSTAAWTGTATIKITESINDHVVDILNPIRLLDSTTSTLMTIKAASTAAVATDTSIVTALNPGTPLPAGANALGSLTAGSAIIGKVGIDQTTPGTTNLVAVSSISTSVTPGTAAANLGKAEDAAAASGDTGVLLLSVRKDTPGSSVDTDGDYSALQVNSTGYLRTTVGPVGTGAGDIGKAEDAAAAGGDAGIFALGVRNDTLASTTSTTGDYSQVSTDQAGIVITAGAPRALKVTPTVVTITSSTSETTVLAAVASTFQDVYGATFTNTSATATEVTLRDATAGTIRWSGYVPAGDMRGFMLALDSAVPQTTVNNNWTVTCGTSVASLKITLFAVKRV